MGTTSISSRSRAVAFRKRACGSEALNGGNGVSKDIFRIDKRGLELVGGGRWLIV